MEQYISTRSTTRGLAAANKNKANIAGNTGTIFQGTFNENRV
jgi:hypothetical protein